MDVFEEIVGFNKVRNLTNFSCVSEYNMLKEELEEFNSANETNDLHEQIDALADIVVVAVGALYKIGYNPTKVLEQTLLEINSREGELNTATGKWEKNRNQDKATLYKADYKVCKE